MRRGNNARLRRLCVFMWLTIRRRHAQYKAAQTEAIQDSIADFETNKTADASSSQAKATDSPTDSKKRKAADAELDAPDASNPKKAKAAAPLYHDYLPEAPIDSFSLFCKADFREYFCRCPECYPHLRKHPQLMEEEESYEPPISESGDEAGGQSVGTGSLLDRGEAALSNVDRVRAIGQYSLPSSHLYMRLRGGTDCQIQRV